MSEELAEIKTIGVIGAGTMGTGIAQVAARSGFKVILHDVREEFVSHGKQTINSHLKLEVEKGRLTDELQKQAIKRISTSIDLKTLLGVDLVIEAISENLAKKMEVFSNLDSMLKPEVILATNTSSISITKLASATARPDRVIGMHFMNPVPIMKLVELIRGLSTSDETFQTVKKLAEKFGKVAILVNDAPGFVSNRILMPMINEAIFTVYEGLATAEAVDEVIKLGMRHPMGPLQLADFIGLDVCLAIMNVLYEGFNDPKYRPCPLLKKYVDAGWLGCKSGRGFYQY
ncbi:MAG: 3-hydroxybutyryl-CoA dehydrogenase [Blastocatellia bacterium]|nr:3-hydroxybutyryl-CoA dehydrogenase [Blastocatellia bacterium]MBN8722396.1 3-hydroxybutyryl-CoA dehydrogenase [Acidobacteriota bacterium]